MLTEKQDIELSKCETVGDIFSSPTLDAVANYRDIITTFLLKRELKEPFIIATINNGNETVVAENIDAISLNENWQIARNNAKFKEILLKNFDKAIKNFNNIDGDVLKQINEEDKFLLINNWKTIVERTYENFHSRKDFISLLNLTEEGRDIIDSQFPELFYGSEQYGPFIESLIREGIVTKDKIADLILRQPTIMIDVNIRTIRGRRYDFSITWSDR